MHWIDNGASDNIEVRQPSKLGPTYSMQVEEFLALIIRIKFLPTVRFGSEVLAVARGKS
jgi:hypothetical protein